VEVYEYFDFDKFNSLGEYEKKKMILDTLQNALIRVATEFSWNTSGLVSAYNSCISRQLILQWYAEKEKYFLSPDRKYYARVWGSMDSDKVELFVIFYNKKKEEISKIKVYESTPCLHEPVNIGWVKDDPLTFRITHYFRKNLFWDAKFS
jgi:hypothetical protein